MTQIDVLGTADRDAWASALARAGRHDFYHEAWYHALAEAQGEGEAALVVATSGEATLALPLLFRPIAGAPAGLDDATSVYGYAGPVGPSDPVVAAELGAAIASYLRERGTVSLFSRLHPLLDGGRSIASASHVVAAGATTSIDLARTPEQQWSATRSGHRNGINRLRRAGFRCEQRSLADIDVFTSIYEGTMRRLDAKPHYFFPRSHYEAFLDPARGAMALLVIVDPDDQPAAVGLFSARCGIAQYHLSGATLEHRKSAPTLLLVDEARRWAMDQGATRLHLGGGVGGARDSLFDFKSGFGDGRHDFEVWRWVLQPELYADLAAQRHAAAESTFFPIYRAA